MFINICYDTKDCNVWENGRVFFEGDEAMLARAN